MDQKCNGGKNEILEIGNGKELEGGVEEKGLMKRDDEEKGKGKVEEDDGMEINGKRKGVEKWWPRNFMDLDEWPPYPWSLENAEEEVLWRWDSNPYWDMELMKGGQAFEEDEEIIWEDDVWHLRDIKEVPIKSSNEIRGSQ